MSAASFATQSKGINLQGKTHDLGPARLGALAATGRGVCARGVLRVGHVHLVRVVAHCGCVVEDVYAARLVKWEVDEACQLLQLPESAAREEQCGDDAGSISTWQRIT